MAVYVDPMMACTTTKQWRWNHACHMFADTLSELHDLADKLELKREWFQDGAFLPHYDLTDKKRRQAVRLGAVDVDHQFTVRFMREHGRPAPCAGGCR